LTQGENEGTLAVWAPAYCPFGSHDTGGICFLVLEGGGRGWDVGEAGSLNEVSPVQNGWILLVNLSHTSGSIPIEVWHIGKWNGFWERRLLIDFGPGQGSMQLEADRQRLIIDYGWVSAASPCEFAPEFEARIFDIRHVDGRRTYEWQQDHFRLISDIYTIGIFVNFGAQFDADSPFPPGYVEEWQRYCVDPLRQQPVID
jgi:hypothetical protein